MAESRSPFNVQKDDVLCSKKHKYVVEELLARGGYGQVVQARKMSTDAIVAIKVVRRDQYASGENEVKILKAIREYTGDKSTIVRLLEHFDHENQFCLAFEMLDMSLFDFIKMKYFSPLEVNEIRVIAQQMLVALNALKRMSVMHRDMKCDNIMLVNHTLLPLRVKLIDFGLSIRTYNIMNLKFKQPLSYRSPDVILNFSQNEAIDMWGLGCVLAFLFLGRHLFPARSEYETLSIMVTLLGQPDDLTLSYGFSTNIFFKCVRADFAYAWRLKTAEEYCKDANEQIPSPNAACFNLSSLDDMQNMRPQATDPLEKADLLCFINLLKQMLDMNPSRRITPNKALNHDFITMKHLCGGTDNPYVTASHRMMERCPEPEPQVENTPSGSSQSAEESLHSDTNKADSSAQTPYSDGHQDSAKAPVGKAKIRTATTPNLPAPVQAKERKHAPLTKSAGRHPENRTVGQYQQENHGSFSCRWQKGELQGCEAKGLNCLQTPVCWWFLWY
ncbi:homeodomain-interacting protein kinase 1-like [Fundulus heteroclitus]|uniref:homeodomain-interacting protein kinase 1-like n=1 Tax=Fundulus heteroclitus TaxID=8078 RepID=UPI00165CCFD7|nr:homeodomain-interacting protein kinase 1-like [Fundulus heteroclitus]